MITDDDLRNLLGTDDTPPSLSPALVRARAGRIRRARRGSVAVVTLLVLPLLALISLWLPGHGARSVTGQAGYPPAFDGYGNVL